MILPPLSLHPVRLLGIPLDPGELTIRGCYIKIPGSPVSELVLENNAASMKPSSLMSDKERISLKRDREADGSLARQVPLQCEIAPSQPLLRVKKTSLTHGAVMLFDGEK